MVSEDKHPFNSIQIKTGGKDSEWIKDKRKEKRIERTEDKGQEVREKDG